MTTVVMAAAGSAYDMGAGLELTIRPRCKGSDRRNREESQLATRRTDAGAENYVTAYIAFSQCKRHGAEPIVADDMPAVR